MGAPSEAHVAHLVKIQPDESLTNTSVQNLTPNRVTCYREAKGKEIPGYNASECIEPRNLPSCRMPTLFIEEEGRILNTDKVMELRDRRGLRQLHDIKWATWELGRPNAFLRKVCYDKSENDKELQMVHWESDKSIRAMKQSNVCGAKGLTGNRGIEDTSSRFETGERKSTESKSVTYLSDGKEVFLKSWKRENRMTSSVRGFVVSLNYRRWL